MMRILPYPYPPIWPPVVIFFPDAAGKCGKLVARQLWEARQKAQEIGKEHKKVLRECPACFLIFLSVVNSSHETDRLSRCA